MMRERAILLAVSLIGVWFADSAYGAAACSDEAAAPQGQVLTVRGEVVDMTCFMGHEGRGKEHQGCTRACLTGGAPAGLLTEQGSVYLLLEDHVDKKPYEDARTLGGSLVRVKGKVFNRGDVLALVVSRVEKE